MNYDKSWGKFMDKLTEPKKYYELTVDELWFLCEAFNNETEFAGVSSEGQWIEKWLKDNIKDEA